MTRAIFVCSLAALVFVSGAQGGSDASITIRLVNSAGVADQTLTGSERQAARVLRKAGVEVVWRDCSSTACPEDLAPDEFWMHVTMWKPPSSSVQNLGFTIWNGNPENRASMAGVYYPMVRQMAEGLVLDEAPILSAAMAHEIGRLLGANDAPAGVMASTFDRSRMVEMSQGGLLFGRDQASRIRSEALRRTNGASASATACMGQRLRS